MLGGKSLGCGGSGNWVSRGHNRPGRFRRLLRPEPLETRAAPGGALLDILLGTPLLGKLFDLEIDHFEGDVDGLATPLRKAEYLAAPVEVRDQERMSEGIGGLISPVAGLPSETVPKSSPQDAATSLNVPVDAERKLAAAGLHDPWDPLFGGGVTDFNALPVLRKADDLEAIAAAVASMEQDWAASWAAPAGLGANDIPPPEALSPFAPPQQATPTNDILEAAPTTADDASRGVPLQAGGSEDAVATMLAPHPLGGPLPTLSRGSKGTAPASDPLPTSNVIMAEPGAAVDADSAGGSIAAMFLGSPPNAVDDVAETDEDTPINIYWLTYNDTEPWLQTITVVGVTQPAHGSAVLEADHTVTYAPAEDWYGTDAFTYTASDGGLTDTASVTVTVSPVNDLPIADEMQIWTGEDTPLCIMLSGTDVESGQLTYFIDTGPSQGTLGDLEGDSVTYFPNGNFHGADAFTYQVYDGERLSGPATVSITVNDVVDGAGVTITPTSGSTQVSEPGYLEGEEAQSDTYTVVLNTAPSANVIITVQPDSQLQVTPSSLTFTPGDWSVAQTVTLDAVADQVAEGDHTGTITHSAASADPVYDGIAIAGVTASVSDPDFAWIAMFPPEPPFDLHEAGPTSADYTVRLTSKPTANVTVTLSPDSQVTVSAASLTFTPANWDMEQIVTVTAVDDAVPDGYHEGVITLSAASADPVYDGMTSEAGAAIIDNDGPSALPDEVSTNEDTPGTFNVTANDRDPGWLELYVTQVTQPAHGSVQIDYGGIVTYTPAGNWYGIDSFDYTMANGLGGSDSATVTVTVNAVNDPPSVTNPGPQSTPEDGQVSVQIVASDVEETAFLYTASELPPGLVMDAMTGRIWGWIDPRASGTYTSYVTVDDLNGGTTTVSFDWTVTDTNHPPVVVRWSHGMTHVGDSFYSGDGVAAADIDEDTFLRSMIGLPPGISYDPQTNVVAGVTTVAGTYVVLQTVDDGHGGTDRDIFLWYVLPAGTWIPFAIVDIADAESAEMSLVGSDEPLEGTVSLYNPGDPGTPYNVTLMVTPLGRSSISPSLVTLRDGETATFEMSPLAVSQKPKDAIVTATVAGRQTGRDDFTNVGVRLPLHVRGLDTPEGMPDRISVGPANWGRYVGVISVFPKLLGIGGGGVQWSVTRPDNADKEKYGNATVSAQDVERGNLLSSTVLEVVGLTQTAATQGQHAGYLHLQAEVTSNYRVSRRTNSYGFSVAAIPIAIKASDATRLYGAANEPPSEKPGWFWGVRYDLDIVADGGSLEKAFLREELKVVEASGIFTEKVGSVLVVGGWEEATGQHSDWNGKRVLKQPKAQDKLQAQQGFASMIRFYDGKSKEEQAFHFYTRRMGAEPTSAADAPFVKESGFLITHDTDQPNMALAVQRKPQTYKNADAGVVAQDAAGPKVVRVLQ